MDKKKSLYLEKREEFNSLSSEDFTKTVLLIFLNKTCFNGMYRENSRGKFNVPFGQHERPAICDSANLTKISRALKKTAITSLNYKDAVKSARRGDFVYFDPPYHPIDATSSFTSYQADGFGEYDQKRLRDLFDDLDRRGCYVMMSNSDTPLINELYKRYKINKIYAARAINSNGAKRGKISEVLVTNY